MEQQVVTVQECFNLLFKSANLPSPTASHDKHSVLELHAVMVQYG